MKEAIKGWLRPLGLILVFIIVTYAFFKSIDITAPMWAWIMIITGFFYGERGIQNVINTYKGNQQ